MGVTAALGGRCEGYATQRPRLSIASGIDKEDSFCAACHLGNFRSELVGGQDLNIVTHQLACKLTRDAPSEPVVAPDGVADADDENPEHMREVASPFGRRTRSASRWSAISMTGIPIPIP